MLLLRAYSLLIALAGAFTFLGWRRRQRESVRRGLTLLLLVQLLFAAVWAGGSGIALMMGVLMLLAVDEIGRHYARHRWPLLVSSVVLLWVLVRDARGFSAGTVIFGLALPLTFVAPSRWLKRPLFAWLFVSGVATFGTAAAIRIGLLRPSAFLSLIILLQLNDGFGLLSGRRFGKHRPFPSVSPNKSLEGYAGGGAAMLLGAGVLRTVVPLLGEVPALPCLALVGGTFLAGNVGDLLLSVLKRALGLKDFSQLLPGHGGIFDRIDSLVCAAPVYLLFWRWLLDSHAA